MRKTLTACAAALIVAFTVNAAEPELPAWAAGTIPKAEAYEKNQADAEYLAKVKPNIPGEAFVKPARPRKLLVFHNPRNYRHTAEVLLRRAVVAPCQGAGLAPEGQLNLNRFSQARHMYAGNAVCPMTSSAS